jgi:nucleoid DNA-binding protein
LNKEKIISTVSIDIGISKEKAEKAVSAVFDTVLKAIHKEGKISIQKFGSFKVYGVKDKDGIEEDKKIKFTPAKKLSLRVNNDFRNLKKVKLKKNLKKREADFNKYEIDIPPTGFQNDEQAEAAGWVNTRAGEQKILISDDLINLHKEITKEIRKLN